MVLSGASSRLLNFRLLFYRLLLSLRCTHAQIHTSLWYNFVALMLVGNSSVVMGVLPPPGSTPPLPAMSVNLGLSAGVVSTSSVPSSTVAPANVLASTGSVMNLLLLHAEGWPTLASSPRYG